MATRYCGQIDPNSQIIDPKNSRSADVWAPMDAVISDWGLGNDDLWARLVLRHEELLATSGVKAQLWEQYGSGTLCTCIKPETGQVNQRCPSCWGSRFIGGYEKFGFCTINIAASNSSLVITNGVVKQLFPDRVEIASGQTSASILTPKYAITQSFGFAGFLLSGYDNQRAITKDNFTIEYTVDGGASFINIEDDTTLLNEPSFVVQFKITMTRPNAQALSPFLEIFRARWQKQKQVDILISKNAFPDQRLLESFGVQVQESNVSWWTTPNLGIKNGKEVRIEENDFFEIIEGGFVKQTTVTDEFPRSGRYKPANVTFIEPSARFLSQRFAIRPLQPDEPSSGVF